MPRCTASTKSGTRCKLQVVENCKFCSVHMKAVADEQQVIRVEEDLNLKPSLEQPNRVVTVAAAAAADDEDDDMDLQQQTNKNDDAYITQLINRIVSLELEVSNQKQTISHMTQTPSNVSNPEVESKQKKIRKPRQYIWTNERIASKARWLFYHEHKKDNDILQAIYTRLAAAGVMYNVTVKVNGAMQEQPFLPWQYIKKTCDNMFDELPPEEKQTYMHQVVSMIN
jgi:hypothetical protein